MIVTLHTSDYIWPIWWRLSPYKDHSLLFSSPALSNTQKHERERKSNPQLKLCVILAIEPMGACNLNVHMTSQARNSLVLQLRLHGAYVNSGRISRATLHPSVYRLVFPCIIIWFTHTCVHGSLLGPLGSSEFWEKKKTESQKVVCCRRWLKDWVSMIFPHRYTCLLP